jgi:hypothetical protein
MRYQTQSPPMPVAQHDQFLSAQPGGNVSAESRLCNTSLLPEDLSRLSASLIHAYLPILYAPRHVYRTKIQPWHLSATGVSACNILSQYTPISEGRLEDQRSNKSETTTSHSYCCHLQQGVSVSGQTEERQSQLLLITSDIIGKAHMQELLPCLLCARLSILE